MLILYIADERAQRRHDVTFAEVKEAQASAETIKSMLHDLVEHDKHRWKKEHDAALDKDVAEITAFVEGLNKRGERD